MGDTIIKASGAEIEFTRGASSNITCSDSSGSLNINTGGANTRMTIAANGQVDFATNVDCNAGLDVTGNITVSGTVDGRDVASDGSKLDGIESGATADQSASEILTAIKTVDGSGSGLDSDLLDGQQGSYYRNASNINAGTISDARLPSSISSDITGNSATATKLANARTIAGVSFDGSANISLNNNAITNGAGYITATLTNEQVQDIVGGMVSGNTESGITVTYQDGDGTLDFSVASQTDNNFTNADHSKLDGIESGATADQTASEILTLIKTVDGSGSGLDADTLDGVSSGSFVRSDADDTLNGQYTISDSANEKLVFAGSNSPLIRFQEGTTNKAYIQWNSGGYIEIGNQESSELLRIKSGSSGLTFVEGGSERTVFHTGNDGSGSGLDADTLDGVQGANYVRTNQNTTITSDLFVGGGAGALTVNANSDIRFVNGTWSGNTTSPKIQAHSNFLYITGGSSGIRFRENGTDRWDISGSGHFVPAADSTYDIGENAKRVANGYFDTLYGDGSNLTGVAAGAVGGGSDEIFYENGQTVTTSYTITNNKNAMAAGPITINSGATVTVGSGENLIIL